MFGLMAATFLAERAISPVDGTVSFVVVDGDYRLHKESSEYLHWLRSTDRSRNTERVYAGRVALFLTYCDEHRLDWRTVTHADLGRFLRSLVAEPISRPMASRMAPSFRSNKTANAIFTAVCEFLRYAARRGWVSVELADSLNHPKYVAVNAMWDERLVGSGHWSLRARSLKLREYDAPPEHLTGEQVAAVQAGLSNLRDQLLVAVLLECGLRIGEALGLRRQDMHLLASSMGLGCSTRGPHLHVRRRGNSNGALAKSVYPRSIPVTTDLVTFVCRLPARTAPAG
jgi:integrase/recombinase XerD